MKKNNLTFSQALTACALLIMQPIAYAQVVLSELESIKLVDIVTQQEVLQLPDTNSIQLKLSINKEPITFELSLNDDLFSNNAVANGFGEGEFLLYKGTIVGVENSWARFSNNNGLITGAFYNGKSLIFVHPYSELAPIIKSDVLRTDFATVDESNALIAVDIENIQQTGTCGLHDHATEESFTYEHYMNSLQEMSPFSAVSTVPNRQISISLYADTEFVAFREFDNNKEQLALQDMLSSLNIADGIFFEQFQIRITVNSVEALSDNGTLISTNPITLVEALKDSNLPNPGLRHLFTGKNLDGSTVGIAYVGSMCGDFSAGITQRLALLTPLVLTHELGHNFGARHDNESGSVCSSTPAGFVMNPSVNDGGSTFSSCSVNTVAPILESYANSFPSCIIEIPSEVVITSTPTTEAELGVNYSYDNDSTIDVEGVGPFSYTLDIGPTSMGIDSGGGVSWTPVAEEVGTNFIQITAQNSSSQDTQTFSVEVTSDFINIKEEGVETYGGPQDAYGGASFGDNPLSVELKGNTWKQLLSEFIITPNTILEFQFSSSIEGEIHGIGFDNDFRLSEDRMFILHGTQNWGTKGYSYTGSGGKQSFSIPVGSFYTGAFDRMILINDNDVDVSDSDSVFSQIRIFEGTAQPKPEFLVDFFNQEIVAHRPFGQDIEGTALVLDEGSAFELTGNKWQKVVLDNQVVNADTVIEFQFKSTSEAEIHGIGFLSGNSIDPSKVFNLYGTQNWGIQDVSYNGSGEYQTFIIPVGQYLTQSPLSLVFIMDDDNGNKTGNSTFKNIKIYTSEE